MMSIANGGRYRVARWKAFGACRAMKLERQIELSLIRSDSVPVCRSDALPDFLCGHTRALRSLKQILYRLGDTLRQRLDGF
jgi:hypothetical protein